MNFHRTSDGTLVDEAAATIAGIVKDGYGVRARMVLMDSAPSGPLHRPGTLTVADDDLDAREASRDERKARLSNAWRDPDTASHQATTAPKDGSVYDRRDYRLSRAWRGGGAA